MAGNWGGVVPKRVALNIGPSRPNPSIAMGIRIVLLSRRLPMTASPDIVGEVL